jgi:DNA-binding NarL/FixJ family response regulator
MSATLTLTSGTAGNEPVTMACGDPYPTYLFGTVTNGWPTSSASGAVTLRCLIVDDSPRFLDAARGLLERQGMMVVGVASTSAEAFQQATELRPDIALVDINLGGESGFDLARRLSREGRLRTQIILISTYAEQDYTDLIAASPVLGFLPKSALSADAIRTLITDQGDGHPIDPVSEPPGR